MRKRPIQRPAADETQKIIEGLLKNDTRSLQSAIARGLDTDPLMDVFGFDDTARFCILEGYPDLLRQCYSAGLTTNLNDGYLLRAVVSHNAGEMLNTMFELGADWESAHRIYISQANISAKSLGDVHDVILRWSRRREMTRFSTDFGKTLSDLRRVQEDHRGIMVPHMMRLAKAGRFDEVIDIVRQTGEKLTVADMMAKDGYGNTILDRLCAQNKVAPVMVADFFENGLRDVKTLVEKMAPIYADQIDHDQLTALLHHEILKKRGKGPRL